MALFSPSESPAIVVKEIDLTGVVPNVQSTTGAIVGNFRWGPVETATLVDNEGTLAARFGTPSDSNAVDFLSASYFLRYSNSLQVVRVIDRDSQDAGGAVNARYPYRAAADAPLVKNSENFDTQLASLDSDNQVFIAKYPGALGNSLKISICPPSGRDSSGTFVLTDSAFTNWTYRSSFDGSPSTSDFAFAQGGTNDEIHLVVIDEDGLFSGTKGTVLETFPYVSLASNAKLADGTTNFIKDVINTRSEYIWMAGFGPAGSLFDSAAGTDINTNENFWSAAADDVSTFSLDSGQNGGALTTGDYLIGNDQLEDKDTITVDFLIAPGLTSQADHVTVVNDLVSIATARKDCVVVTSPNRAAVVGNAASSIVNDTTTTSFAYSNSSYLVADNNYLKVYDKYNDKYRFIPAASSTAGLMAATDLNAAPWFSPAGSRRGAYLGITSLAYTPTKAQRDTLYKAAVNPIANIPGQGVLLFGDKTNLLRPSAFDRINVRRLFLTIERAIALAARNVLFEFNDEFTRAEFVNIVEPFLREIQGRRGITDFRVVCDETNNTPAVIDRNEFIATIFIKPARSINYVTLNFVAVRTGVDFEEVVGTV
jgi:hypothetical protein